MVLLQKMQKRAKDEWFAEFKKAKDLGKVPKDAGKPVEVYAEQLRTGSGVICVKTDDGREFCPYYTNNLFESNPNAFYIEKNGKKEYLPGDVSEIPDDFDFMSTEFDDEALIIDLAGATEWRNWDWEEREGW